MNIFDQPALTKSFVREILEHPVAVGRQWTWQGLGMLRMYLTSRFRLHVWAPSKATHNVSTLHTHPWDFTSYVVAGSMQNKVWGEVSRIDSRGHSFLCQKIKCGTGGGLCEEKPKLVHLILDSFTVIKEGESYSEQAEQIHESVPVEGTVTIVDRKPREDADHAFVFWPDGEEWVSAEPRPATHGEVVSICGFALETWFK